MTSKMNITLLLTLSLVLSGVSAFGFVDVFAETLIVASSEADPSHFSKVNIATGNGTQFLGNSGLGFSGIDFSSDGKLYAASAGNLANGEIPGLYELNGGSVVTPSLVAPGFACSDISFSPNGLLYCISNGDSYFPQRSLVSYNFNTDVSTLIGSPAFDTNSNGNAIAVDSGSLIYFGNKVGLYTLNPVNAAPTLVGEWTAHEDNDDCLKFNQPGTFRGQTTGMDFDSSGDLYASFQCNFNPYLGKINISDGTVTILGPLHSEDPVYQVSPFGRGDMKTSALVFAPSDFDSRVGLYPGNSDELPADFNFLVGSTFGIVEIVDPDVMVNVEPNDSGGVLVSTEDHPANVDLCDNSSLAMDIDTEFNAECGSVTIQVVSGTVDATFEADSGSIATSTLNQGDDVTFDEVLFSLTNNGIPGTDDDVVLFVDGVEKIISPGETLLLGETPVPSNFRYEAVWNSGSVVNEREIFPISKSNSAGGLLTAPQYYSYSNPDGASANTPDDLEESQVAQFFLFDDGGILSLFLIMDIPRDADGGQVDLTINSEGLAGEGIQVTVRDDPGDSSYVWDDSNGSSNPTFNWAPCCTDGMVLSGFPIDSDWSINMQFLQRNGLSEFKVKTFDSTGTTIESFSIPSNQVNTLQIRAITSTGSIGDTVFDDQNNNGLQDTGEPGIEGVTVNLDGESTTSFSDSQVTDANGNYLFSDIPTDSYFVTIDTTTIPENFEQSNVCLETFNVSISPDEVFLGADFCLVLIETDIDVIKNGPSTAIPGDTIRYDIRVNNLGDHPARNVVVTDTIPTEIVSLELVDASPVCTEITGIIQCDVGEMAADSFFDIFIELQLPPNESGIISNIATVTSDNDPNDSNNSSPVVVTEISYPPTEHFMSYKTKDVKGSEKFDKFTVTLSDNFNPNRELTVEKTYRLFNPIDKNDEGLDDTVSHMMGYKIKEPKGEPKSEKIKGIMVSNQFGDVTLDVKKPKLLLVPSAKDHFAVPEVLDPVLINHFTCYDVKETKHTPKFEKRDATVYDPNFDSTVVYEVKKPKMLCIPTEKTHDGITSPILSPEENLLCYDTKKDKGESKFEKVNVFTNNQFGADEHKIYKVEDLCVPSTYSFNE